MCKVKPLLAPTVSFLCTLWIAIYILLCIDPDEDSKQYKEGRTFIRDGFFPTIGVFVVDIVSICIYLRKNNKEQKTFKYTGSDLV